MTGFLNNIEERTLDNTNFRQVIFTGQHTQVVLMSLAPQEDIGKEVHAVTDQFIRVESGTGTVIMNGEEQTVADGDAFVVPAGTEHNLINTSTEEPLKLYTLYSPPHHKDGTVHETKQAALNDTEDHL